MKGGTYSQALHVGFTEQQAGFLARMGVETRSEAIEEMDKMFLRRENAARAKRDAASRFAFRFIVIFSFGTLAGIFLPALWG